MHEFAFSPFCTKWDNENDCNSNMYQTGYTDKDNNWWDETYATTSNKGRGSVAAWVGFSDQAHTSGQGTPVALSDPAYGVMKLCFWSETTGKCRGGLPYNEAANQDVMSDLQDSISDPSKPPYHDLVPTSDSSRFYENQVVSPRPEDGGTILCPRPKSTNPPAQCGNYPSFMASASALQQDVRWPGTQFCTPEN